MNELFAILLARDLREEDRMIQIGANMPMARAAAVYASVTALPDARVSIGLGIQSLDGRPAPAVHPYLFDPRTLDAESLMFQSRVFDAMERPDVFFVGGLQVDRRGNINLFGIPDGEGGWKMRGPGSVALATMSTHCRGYYIVMPNHDQRTFVERVALISALGDVTEREKLGFPGGGVRMILSPLGVFELNADGDMQARSLHEGVDADQVRESTGFEILVPDDVPVTDPPSDEELDVLRNQVDLEGTLS